MIFKPFPLITIIIANQDIDNYINTTVLLLMDIRIGIKQIHN